ncbi:MAG: right-handed parallel beta-helix repeat-containing protein [Ignavibacteriae bacterium]|nr:right-handed parallel beta-helix repeat-containing protein [Ignavibacteriota bacterium]
MSALTGTHYIGSLGDYASLKQAIDSVNILGVGAGGVTFSFFSSHVEKSANMNITTTTASSSNPLIFQYFGYTNIPKIYAAAGTSTTNDAIIKICGTDYVTFDNIQFIDTNTISATNQMEWGIAVLKASGSDGSQNITIKNCSVKLKVNYTAGVGIYSNNHTSASLSQLTVTSFSGTNSYLKIYNNTVDGPYIGIQITGYNHTSSPYNLYDHGNEIGVGGQNFIVNFGGSTTANYGIYASYQDSIKISNNYVGSNYGSTNAVYGIYTAAGTGSAVDIHSNEVSLSSGSTASNMYGIKNDMGSSGTGNTVNIDMNTIHNCINNYSLATLDQYAINNTATPSVLNIFGNNISDNRSRGTGAFYGISAGSSPLKRIYNNQIYNNIREGSNGVMYLIHVSGGTSTVCYGNSIYNDSIPSASGGSNSVVCGYVNSSGGGALDSIFNNNIYNLGIKGNTTATSTAVYGIFSTGPTSKSIFGNNIYNLNTKIGSVQGIYASASGYFNLYGNRIYGLRDSTTTYGEVYGINITSGTSTNIYNNFISELYTPVLNKQDAIYGMFIGGSSGNIVNLYYNTIYLDASSTGSLFGTNGIYAFTAPLVELSNNLVINKSVPGNGNYLAKTVAFKRSGSLLTTYSGASNNNCFYSGTPDTSRVIFFDGTNFDRTLSEWKARITPRESNSVSVNPVFKNSASKPYNLHLDSTVISLLESGGRIISSPLSITQDFDGHSRYPNSGYPNNPLSPATAPDIGADEFAGKNSLAGTFYVQPTGGNYANLTDAVNDLNNNLIGAGGVTFLIQSGQTFNEPAPLNITATGTASNQIIFKRNGNGARPVINVMGTGSYGEACIRLNGSDYITFDSLEIRDAGTSYTTYNANVFYFRSISSDSNGCQNNTVSNCVISMSNDNMNSCGVYLSTNASLYAGTNSRNRFLNDSVIKCVSGYKFQGSNSFPDIGNRIGTTGNGRSKLFNIGGNSANPFYAVYLWGQDSVSVFNTDIDSVWSSMYASKTGIQISMNNNVTVSGNTIHGFRRASMQSDETGIAVYYTNSAVISNNKIYDLNSSGSATGIQVLNSFVSFIYNNFIYDLKSSSTYSMVKGIDLSGGTADSVFYNTVYLDYASVSSNNKSAALYVGSGVTLIDLRNNIFVNKTDVSAGSLAAAFYSDAGSHSNISPNSNNNLFYAGTPSLNNLIYYNSGLSYSDSSISQYKTHLAPKDSNAFTENPHFIRTSPPYDLHIDTRQPEISESRVSG